MVFLEAPCTKIQMFKLSLGVQPERGVRIGRAPGKAVGAVPTGRTWHTGPHGQRAAVCP